MRHNVKRRLAVPSQVVAPLPDPVKFFGQNGDVRPTTWLEAAPKTLQRHGHSGGVKEEAGLFWYSSFGYGTLYLPGGTTVWCATTRAAEYCKLIGVTFKNEDPLKGYSGTYLGD